MPRLPVIPNRIARVPLHRAGATGINTRRHRHERPASFRAFEHSSGTPILSVIVHGVEMTHVGYPT